MVSIFAVKIEDKLSDYYIKLLMDYVLKEKEEQINRYVFKADANRTLVGDVLVRFLIRKKLNISNEQIHFESNKYGKKRLMGRNDFHFNISHSGEWVVCSMGNYENGIDVEKIQPIDIDLVKRIFKRSEYLHIKNMKLENQSQEFIRIWTLKESYIKCIGKGLSIPLDSFEFEKVNDEFKLKGKEQNKYKLEQMQLNDEYYVAICSYKEEVDKKINYIDIAQLLQ